jgi:hypothetical protein
MRVARWHSVFHVEDDPEAAQNFEVARNGCTLACRHETREPFRSQAKRDLLHRCVLADSVICVGNAGKTRTGRHAGENAEMRSLFLRSGADTLFGFGRVG